VTATATQPMRSTPDWRWIASRLLLAFPAVQLWVILAGGIRPPEVSDYYYLYAHAEMVRAGEALYWPWPDYGPHYMSTPELRYPAGRQPYPPFLTPVLSGLSRFGVEVFAHVWVVLLWAAYWVYAACLAKLAHGRIALVTTIGWGIALFVLTLRGAQSAILLGNVDPILWAFFGAALAYPAFRGVGFMGIALIKLYGVWPLLVATLDRDGRTIRAAASTLLAGVVVAAAILGPGRFITESLAWFQHMLPVLGQGTFNGYNVSISFFALRIARWVGWEYVAGPLTTIPRLYLTLVGIAAPVVVAWLLRRSDRVLRYALVLCAAVFFAPLAWNFYAALLLAPLAILYRRWRTDRGDLAAVEHDLVMAPASATAGPKS
jgi:hypothetical protein